MSGPVLPPESIWIRKADIAAGAGHWTADYAVQIEYVPKSTVLALQGQVEYLTNRLKEVETGRAPVQFNGHRYDCACPQCRRA